MGKKYGLDSQEFTAAEQLELDRACRIFGQPKQTKSKFETQVDDYLNANLTPAWVEYLRKDNFTY